MDTQLACRVPERSPSVFDWSATVLLIAVGSAIIGQCVYRGLPWQDPVDVVGLPLLIGYSERGEQWGYYAFWLATVAASVTWRLCARSISNVTPRGVSIAAMLTVMALPWFSHSPANTTAMVLEGAAIVICGQTVARIDQWTISRRFTLWSISLTAWCLGCETWHTVINGWQIVIAWFLVGGALWAWNRQSKTATVRRLRQAWLWLIPFGCALAACVTTPRGLTLGLCGFAVFWLSQTIANRCHREPQAASPDITWLALAGIIVILMHRYVWLLGSGELWNLVGGAGLAGLVLAAWCETSPKRESPRLEWCLATWPHGQRKLCWLVLSVMATAIIVRPWFGGVLAVTLWVIVRRDRPGQTTWWRGLALASALAAALLPGLPGRHLDFFHDAYNLSSVWEFESGRTLYTEVFSIRGFYFFAAWLSRRVLPQTLEAYLLTFRCLQILPACGAALVGYRLTRSPLWGLAMGLFAGSLDHPDARQGMNLCLLGGTVWCLSSRHALRWLGLAVTGTLATLCGYDSLMAVVIAAVTAVGLTPLVGGQRESFVQRLIVSGRSALGVAAAMLVPFCLLIVAWQGTKALADYWQFFFDATGYFSVFTGAPLNWSNREERLWIVLGLLLPSAWTVCGVWHARRMRDVERRTTVFVIGSVFFLLHRVLGRSGEGHTTDLLYPTIVLGGVGIFRLLSFARPAMGRVCLLHPSVIALAACAYFAWFSPRGRHCDPRELVDEFRSLSPNETGPLGEREFVLQRVPPDGTLWGIENTATYYVHRRHNATRHALGHIICSPREQRRTVAALAANHPALIEWPAWRPETPDPGLGTLNTTTFAWSDVMNSIDSVAAPLRYHIISQHLFRHYRPSNEPGFLEPASEGWLGLIELPRAFNGHLEMRRLPLTWGETRMLDAAQRSRRKKFLSLWQPIAMSHALGDTAIRTSIWELSGEIHPREWNYLELQLDARWHKPGPPETETLTIEFTPTDWGGQTSSVTLDILPIGTQRWYLIPIGCSPGWSWRSRIAKVRLTTAASVSMFMPQVVLLDVDDLRP